MHENEPELPTPQPEGAEAADQQHEGPQWERPRIYVASLSDYNAGLLHGTWLEADSEVEQLDSGISAMLAASPTTAETGEPAEEWAIHDYEHFGLLRLGEYESLDHVVRVGRGIAEHGPAFAAWAAHIDQSDELDRFEEVYRGEWNSLEDYADELLEDLGLLDELDQVVPELLQAYVSVDVERLARDMELDGMVTTIEKPDGGVWVFETMS